MQNRNATDMLNRQCSKLALFANTITEICIRITMLVYYIVDLAYRLFAFGSGQATSILCKNRAAENTRPEEDSMSSKRKKGSYRESHCL